MLVQRKLNFSVEDNDDSDSSEKDKLRNTARKCLIEKYLMKNDDTSNYHLPNKFNKKYLQKSLIRKALVKHYLDNKLYEQEGCLKDVCFSGQFKNKTAYQKRFFRMQRRFKFYESEVLKELVLREKSGRIIKIEEMKDLLLKCAEGHEVKRNRQSIDNYYTCDLLNSALKNLSMYKRQISIGYRIEGSYIRKKSVDRGFNEEQFVEPSLFGEVLEEVV